VIRCSGCDKVFVLVTLTLRCMKWIGTLNASEYTIEFSMHVLVTPDNDVANMLDCGGPCFFLPQANPLSYPSAYW